MTRLAFAAALAVGLAGPAAAAQCRDDVATLETTAAPVDIAVEIADDEAERSRGLMFRTELPRDAGMLFLFDPPRPVAFWMKNTPLSLDMIFIGADGVVCNVIERTTPYSLEPRPSACPSRAVLEVVAGVAAEHGFRAGTRVRHPAFGPAAAWPCPAPG